MLAGSSRKQNSLVTLQRDRSHQASQANQRTSTELLSEPFLITIKQLGILRYLRETSNTKDKVQNELNEKNK